MYCVLKTFADFFVPGHGLFLKNKILKRNNPAQLTDLQLTTYNFLNDFRIYNRRNRLYWPAADTHAAEEAICSNGTGKKAIRS